MSITSTVPLNQKVDTIAFVNTATRTGVLNGPLILCHDHSHRNLRVIELHWGATHRKSWPFTVKLPNTVP